MNKIIKDEKLLLEFVESLPVLTEDECFYVSLFARKKYHPSAKNDRTSCKRFIANSPEFLLKKIKELEISRDYTNKDGSPVHEDALVLYININPRSKKKAQKHLLKKLVDVALEPNDYQNPVALALTSLQKSKSRTVYIDFDFDDIPFNEYKPALDDIINKEAYKVIVTRGGFHLLVNPNLIDNHVQKNWYTAISRSPYCDVAGDNLVPVPGCTQGGFIPYIYK